LYNFYIFFKKVKVKPTLQYIALVSRLKISEDVSQSDGKSDSFATDTAACWLRFLVLENPGFSEWLILGTFLVVACDLNKKVIDITPTRAATVNAAT
jgi:hypothetical protein